MGRSRAWRLVAGALAAGAVLAGAACSLVSRDEFSGGSPAGSDGGGDGTSALCNGTPCSAPPADASLIDAADAADASPCRFPHAFCDDFDTHVLTDLWEVPTTTDGTYVYDSTASTSPPRSLVLTCGNRDCSLSKHLPKATHIVVDFQVEQVDPASDVTLASVAFAGVDQSVGVNLSANIVNFQVCTSTGCEFTSRDIGALSPTRFHRLTLDVVPNAQATLSYDGVPGDTGPLEAGAPPGIVFSLGCGIAAACPDHSAVRFDDVIVDLQ